MRRFADDRLVIATHNACKLEEMRHLLLPHGVTALGAAELGLKIPDETEESFAGNARLKAREAMRATGLPALADDSGLTVDGLDGAPGVRTADWAETPGGRDYPAAMAKVWRKLDERNVVQPRTAQFRATLALIWPDGEEAVFEGIVPGTLVWPMRGALGHGYDPFFVPDGHSRAFGEMSADEKNRISHRADAFRKLQAVLA